MGISPEHGAGSPVGLFSDQTCNLSPCPPSPLAQAMAPPAEQDSDGGEDSVPTFEMYFLSLLVALRTQ